MDERTRVANEIASMRYQKDRASFSVPITHEVGKNSEPVYKGARPDQVNPYTKPFR